MFEKEFLAFHISGGTTEAVLAKGSTSSFTVKEAAKTLDLNAGQAVDRVGLMLGLKFPCGPQLEQLALNNTEKFNGYRYRAGNGNSGECRSPGHEVFGMTEKLLEQFGNLPVIFAGGVMSNSIIRNALTEKFGATFAKPEYSADNAAGIAYLAYKKYTEI